VTGNASGDAWARIEALVAGTDFTALTLAVVDLSAEQRRALIAPLRAYVPARKYDPMQPVHEAGLAIVGAGVLPDAKSVTAWLNRYGMWHVRPEHPLGLGGYVETSVVPNVFYLLTERGVPWLGDLAKQIAERLPRAADFGKHRFELVCRLLEHTGTPVPTSPGFVAGWMHQLRPDSIVEELSAHPEFAVLVPHFFDVEEVGAQLSHYADWPEAIAGLVARGVVDRDVLLDACLARLVRGGRPGATRAFLAVHDALAPTTAEVTARIGAYLDVLGSTESTVASTAQQRLFELDDRGVLSVTDQLELGRAMLRRKEKKLVRAQLARIGKLPSIDTGRKTEFARLIASSWVGTDADLIRQGIRTIAAMRLPESAHRDVLDAAPDGLPADLAVELVRVFGEPAAVTPAVTPLPNQLAPPPRVALAPVTDPDALAAATEAVLTGRAADLTTARLESLIDGLLTKSAQDRGGLRRALEPVLASDRFRWLRDFREYSYSRSLRHALWALATAAVGEAPTVHPRDPHETWSGPEAVLVDRVFALATQQPLPPLSVCLPTWTNGLLDPDALIDRLGRAATDGWRPPPREIEQALLRLDVPADPDQQAALSLAFAGLGTESGRIVTRWITAHLPTPPIIERTVVTHQRTNWDDVVVDKTELVQTTVQGAAPTEWPGGIWAGLVQPHPGSYLAPEDFRSPLCWPAVAPRNREVIAAHCVGSLAGGMDSSSRIAEVLPVIAEIDGPIGDATSLALGYGLCAGRAEQRAVAQRGLMLMCGRAEWDGAGFGRALGDLFLRRSVVMKRAVEPLREVATQGGATALWPALREIVAALLADGDVQPGLGDVLALSAEVAQAVPAPDLIPGLPEFAGRTGRSRQLAEARRLAGLLSR
jgi:hypothetical protein